MIATPHAVNLPPCGKLATATLPPPFHRAWKTLRVYHSFTASTTTKKNKKKKNRERLSQPLTLYRGTPVARRLSLVERHPSALQHAIMMPLFGTCRLRSYEA